MAPIRSVVKVAVVGVCLSAVAVPVLWADVATPRPRWTTVRMESEAVNIVLGTDRVKVEATFRMYNEGKEGSVRMGYPVGLFEDKLNDFEVSVDGVVQDVRAEANPAGGGSIRGGLGGPGGKAGAEPYRFEGPYKEWKVFDVPMAANEAKTVKVTYWVAPAKVKDADKGDLLHYSYTLRTGATWKGKINEAVINVKLDGVDPKALVRVTPRGCTKSQDGKAMTWTLRDFKPTDDVEITYRPA